jgi:hypothetical protein
MAISGGSRSPTSSPSLSTIAASRRVMSRASKTFARAKQLHRWNTLQE